MKTPRILVALVGAGLTLVLVVIGVSSAAAEEAAVAREAAPMAPAATIVVTSTADSGPGTLRQALLDAVGGDVINFDTGVFPPGNPQTITLSSGLPTIVQDNLTIDASNAGVILDGSGIGTNVETQLFDDISLTIDGGPNLLVNGDFDAGMGHWRPFDERETPTRTLNTSDFQSAPNAFQWSGNAHQSQSRTVYDPNDTSDPFSSWPFGSGSSIWISATGNSTATVSLWYKDGLSSVGLWALYSDDNTEQIAYWDLSQVTVWTTATLTHTLPGNAVAVALDLQHRHNEQWISGLLVQSDGNTIRGLQIIGFPGNGIKLDENTQGNTIGGDRGVGSGPLGQGNLISANGADGVYAYRSYSNTISGNLIGTDVSGTSALGNTWAGVSIDDGGSYNLIGGDTPGERNLISGNGGNGVQVYGSTAMSNTISGNYIGTDINGTSALSNAYDGVNISNGASYNLVGGDTPGERNLISGNGSGSGGNGVAVCESTTMSNTVSGNYIGTDVSGALAVGNDGDGIQICNGTSYNLIGGDTPSERNLISGNGRNGVQVFGSDTMSNTVSGNYIGTDVSGTTALGNGQDGIWIGQDASYNTVGGSTAGERNLVSGNYRVGVSINGQGDNAGHNVVQGNYIGTDVSGAVALGNGWGSPYTAVEIYYTADNVIADNLISGNYGTGITVYGDTASGNVVRGNLIGTDVSGTSALSNTRDGVSIGNGASYNLVGGDTPSERNLISGNGQIGVWVGDSNTMSNTVSGNYIGTDVSGTAALGNTWQGVTIGDGASYNLVGGGNGTPGGVCTGACNLIGGNGRSGVGIWTNSNTVSGNYIGTDVSGTVALGNAYDGVNISNGASYNLVGGDTPGERNLISGSGGNGVAVCESTTMSNTVSGNYIGTDVSGALAIGNDGDGIQICNGTSYNLIGGDTPGERNLISGNGGNGVQVYGSATMSNTISGNYIGTDVSGTAALGNTWEGLRIGNGASYNLVGGDNGTPGGLCTGACNLIGGNGGNGTRVDGSATMSNTISGNYIGTDVNGTSALSNTYDGVSIGNGASYNLIGGDTSGERNLISGNRQEGIWIGDSDTMSNTISGNYIGTDASGTAALGNGWDGIWIGENASYNTIGGSTAGERNLISGNYRVGVSINGEGNNAGHNVIQGNYIGTDASGTVALGNGWGDPYTAVELYYTADNIVADNLISGNYGNGISFSGDTASGNVVRGNYIGTDVSGALALGNGTTPNDGHWGITLGDGAHHNTIGGTSAGDRNVISGNGDLYCGPPELARADGGGIAIWDTAHDNVVQGNTIGMDVTGLTPIPNARVGIEIYAASDNLIGGTAPGAGNLISGNSCGGPPPSRAGIQLGGDGNTIQGNIIGPDVTGADIVSTHDNGWAGIWIVAAGNLIEDNLIAGNGGYDGTGIFAWGTSTVSNTLTLNTIYGHGGKGISLNGGANGYMFPPLLTEVSATSAKGFAVPSATIEVFSDDDDEGRWYHGSTTADGTGAFTFTTTFTGTNVTATATDADGNTSEFSSPYHPSRDVIAAAIYVPQPRHAVNVPITPTVRVGNGGTAAETFTVTAVITRSSDGTRVYSATRVVVNLGVFNYRSLALPSWLPLDTGSYTFELAVRTAAPDDDTSNDRLTQAFVVADDRVDLWARDNPTDDGREPSVGPVWQSPDVWVRNVADGGTTHQDPINTITNTVYLTVRNQGTLTATDVVATVYWHPPSLVIGQSWWQPIGTVTVTQLAPGATQVVSMAWPLNIAGLTGSYHTCLLGVLTSVGDPAPVMWDVRSSNNIIQRNVDVIPQQKAGSGMDLDFAASAAVSSTFKVGNPYPGEQLVDVIVDASGVPTTTELWIDLGGLYERWEQMGQGSLIGAAHVDGTTVVTVAGGTQAEITGIPMAGEELVEVAVEIYGLDPGQSVQIDVSERIGGDVLGGITLAVTAVEYKIHLPLVLRSD